MSELCPPAPVTRKACPDPVCGVGEPCRLREAGL